MGTSALWEFVSSTFPGEATLREEWNLTLWNSNFNITAPHVDEKDRNKGVSRYMSTKKLLVKHMKDREKMPFAKALATMDLGLGGISAASNVDQGF